MEQKNKITISRADDYRKLKETSRQQPPKKIIEEGISLSTGIQDKEKLMSLAEKAMRAEPVTQEKDYDTFLFGIAESIDSIKNGTSSENEYFEWIERAQRIMLQMSDGTVTQEDIDVKKEFITQSYQRETELLVCLALYEKSNHPLAKERYAALKLKLQRLRQLRSLLKSSTKARADDKPLTPEEKVRIAQSIRSLDEMREEEGKVYEDKTLVMLLRQMHLIDWDEVEFYKGYSFYTHMLDEQRDIDFEETRSRMLDYAQRLEDIRHADDTKEQIYNRIQNLRGIVRDKPAEPNKIRSAFNAELFRRLRNLSNEKNGNN